MVEYLGELGQNWREDSSNRDLRHTRNRVRHGILPRLEENVNPAVREALAEAAEIARGEEEYWAGEIARVLPEVWNRTDSGGELHHERLAEFDLAVRRRVVRACGESLGLGLDFRHVEEVLALRDGGRASLQQDCVVCLRKGELRFELLSKRVSEYKYELAVPGEVLVPEAGLRVKAVRVESAGQDGADLAGSQVRRGVDCSQLARGGTLLAGTYQRAQENQGAVAGPSHHRG